MLNYIVWRVPASMAAILFALASLPAMSQNPSAGLQQVPSAPFATGWFPGTLVTADFNGDGKLDLATANHNDGTVTVLLGRGDGTFAPAPGSSYTVGFYPNWLVAGDFNGDGFSDLAITTGNSITILLGSAGGNMSPAAGSPISAGSSPQSIAVGDFNKDGKLDLIVSNQSQALLLLLGDGQGGFTPSSGPAIPTVVTCGCALAAGSFTSSGGLDVVVLSPTGNALVLLQGDGAGGFTAGTSIATASGPVTLAIGDLNNDGNRDIVVGTSTGGRTILLGDGQAHFTATSFTGLESSPTTGAGAVGLADMNGDGWLDLVIPYSTTFEVLLGDGTGSFAAPAYFEVSGITDGFIAFVAGDFNGDGRQDLAAADAGDNKIDVLLGMAKAADTLTLAPEAPLIAAGTPITLFANVQTTNVYVNPTGTVTFLLGTTVVGAAVPITNLGSFHSATLVIPNAAVGDYTYTANYSGDQFNLPSSAIGSEQVTQTGPPMAVWTISITNSGTFYYGQANATYTIALSLGGNKSTVGFYTVAADLPQGETFVSMSGSGWSCGGAACGRGDTFTPPATLPPITLTVNIAENAPSSLTASASIFAGGAMSEGSYNTVTLVSVTPPFGYIDTPMNNITGVSGAIGFTGWALGREGVQTVGLWREPVAGEPQTGLIFLTNASIVPGSRPDVASAYPGYPCNNCGWGAQILTNELPDTSSQGLGNGTYNIHAIATDGIGQTTDLGVRTINVDNAASTLPFGTIDTPAAGATISGTAYINFGWALTPPPNIIATDGSTITVFIDNAAIGHPDYNNGRADIESLFPGYANTDGAVGFFIINTTTLSNGLHQISWSVTDSAGNATGIGSRFFTVQN